MLNAKLERIHKVISVAYFFFVGLGLWMIGSGLVGPGLMFVFGIGPVGLFHWYAAKGARAGARWGRNMSRVIGVFLLIGFPLGTALGIYILSQTGDKWQGKNQILQS